MESLTHQQTLNFAGNLSLPCHKALLNLLPPKPTSRFQKPELPVEIPCSALIIASPAGTCGKGKKKSHGFLDTRFTKGVLHQRAEASSQENNSNYGK